jgi:predicted TIM-barrel fold metal-dependent hydrolase
VGEVKPIEFVRETSALSDAQKDKIVGANAAALLGLS